MANECKLLMLFACFWNNDIMAWQLKQLNVAEGLMDLSQRVSSETCWNQTIKFLDIVQ